MKPNPGHCPSDAIGKRVRVRLVRADVSGAAVSFEAPADGRDAPSWSRRGSPFDIAEYEVLG